jgi:hypothetical protein
MGPMADQDPTTRGEHPVLTGLIALIGVALVVGLILGGGALAATKVLGLDDDGTGTDEATSGDSMVLPHPQPTETPSGPLVTLGSDATNAPETDGPEETETAEPEHEISLAAGQTTVGPMDHIDLTGVYPGGEGAILQVQRFEGGKWADFPVPISVSDETFATYVQTSQPGVNRFRVIDTDTGATSNDVRVTIG